MLPTLSSKKRGKASIIFEDIVEITKLIPPKNKRCQQVQKGVKAQAKAQAQAQAQQFECPQHKHEEKEKNQWFLHQNKRCEQVN